MHADQTKPIYRMDLTQGALVGGYHLRVLRITRGSELQGNEPGFHSRKPAWASFTRWPWVSYLTTLSFSFLIRNVISSTHRVRKDEVCVCVKHWSTTPGTVSTHCCYCWCCFGIIIITITTHHFLGMQRTSLHCINGHCPLPAPNTCQQANLIHPHSESYLVAEYTKCLVINDSVLAMGHEDALTFLLMKIPFAAQPRRRRAPPDQWRWGFL